MLKLLDPACCIRKMHNGTVEYIRICSLPYIITIHIMSFTYDYKDYPFVVDFSEFT